MKKNQRIKIIGVGCGGVNIVKRLYVINNELSFQSLAPFPITEAFAKVNIMAEDAILSMIEMYTKATEPKTVGRHYIFTKIWRRFLRHKTNSHVETLKR